MIDLTIGIEEEYQLIDPESQKLISFIQEFLEDGKLIVPGNPGFEGCCR